MGDEMDLRTISKAFSPSLEIRDPRAFVGRHEEVKSAISALSNPGSFIAIFGLRGVGKSSIATQVKLIAEGNRILPEALNLDKLLPNRGFNFTVHYYRCDGFTKTIPDLLKRILFGDEENPSLFSLTKSGDRRLSEFKRTIGVNANAGFFGAKVGTKGSEETKYVPYISDDLVQQFRSLLGTIRKDNQEVDGILILIDEFDTIENKEGFSSIVKACSSEYVKFGVVGIGSNISELIADHSSIGRQVDFINVPKMPRYELEQIIRRAEFVAQNITFDDEATREICEKSEGFPYFTHLLGKESMVLAFESGASRITPKEIKLLFSKISEGRLSNIFEAIYHESVKNSPQRELLLKLFAEDEDNEINSGGIYETAKEMGISNPPQLMKQLTTAVHANATPVLTKIRDRYYRFTDPVFKVYARIRNWKFQ